MSQIKKYKDRWVQIVELPKEPGEPRKRKWIYGTTREEVKDKVTKLLYDIQVNQYVDETNITVGAYLNNWLKSHKPNIAPYTYNGYEVNIRCHIIPYIGEIKLSKLTTLQIQNLYNKLIESGRTDGKGGLSAKSVIYVHRVLRKALNEAVVIYKLIGKNPIEGVKPPKMKKPKHDIFNEDSLAELLIRVRGHEFEIPINMAAALGMRRGEILGLHWNNVDFDIGKIYVREELIWTKETRIDYKEPKSDESIRDIDIPASLISLLKKHHIKQEKDKLFFGTEYKDNNLVVCQDNGEPYLPYSFTKRFKTLIDRLDIGKTTFHGLRHAYATLQLKYGTSMKEVSGLLGHSTIQFSQDSYQHVLDDMKRKAAKKINDKLYKKVNKVVAIK